jgi:putative transposase
VCGTLNRERLFDKSTARRISEFLNGYAESKAICMNVNYVNADHVHALVDLPTAFSIEQLMQLLKGGSSHWINANNLLHGKFAWGRDYGAFSVSESNVEHVTKYITTQEEHHRVLTFGDEIKEFLDRHGLRRADDKAVETAKGSDCSNHRPEGRC